MRKRLELARQRGVGVDDILQRRTVLLLQPLEDRQAIFDFLQPGGRRVDLCGVRPQEVREILELRLDRVAGGNVRLKLGVDRRQLADPFPDRREPGQRGAVSFLQSGVRLGAQALQPFGIGEHLPAGRQLFVLP